MSATLVGVVRGLFAIGRVDLDEGGDPEFTINRGFIAVDNPDVGVYILTTYEAVSVDTGFPNDAATVLVTCQGTDYAVAMVSQTPTQFANSQIEVDLLGNIGEGFIPVDVPFGIQIQDVSPN